MTITPGTRTTRLVLKKAVTTKDISAAGHIDIRYYKGLSKDIPRLLYRELTDLKVQDTSANIDLLWKLTQPVPRAPRPGWSGMMQMVCGGYYPGQSTIMFLPMIEMEPRNMTCIYSTLIFISK